MNYHRPVKEIKNIVEHISLICALILIIFGVTAVANPPSSVAQNITSNGSSATSSYAYPDSYTSTGGNMTLGTEDGTTGGEPLIYDDAASNCFDYGGCGNATTLEEANLLVQVNVLGGTAEASDFMIEVSSYTMDSSIPLDPNPFTFAGNEAGTPLTYTFYETPTSEISYGVNIIQQPSGDYSPQYNTGCTGTWKLGEYITCVITISYEEPVSAPVESEPVSSQEPVSAPVESEPSEDNNLSPPVNLATPIVGTSSTPLVTDTFPSVLIIAGVLLGGIGLGKYSNNLKRGRSVKIPPSAVVDITTKGGRRE